MLTHTYARYHPEQTTSVLFEGHRRRGSRKENILKLYKIYKRTEPEELGEIC